MTPALIQADARHLPLADKSVHCVVTSPPYFGLRDYGVTGQIGLEKSYQDYLAQMVAVMREVRRVLRDDGTVWLNIGDSYAGSWGNYGGQNRGKGGGQREIISGSAVPNPAYDGLERFRPPTTNPATGIKPKDLMGIPWRLAFALQDDGWWLRQDIIWAKPNPMPESVRDRCTKSHEYIFLLTKKDRYYFDQEAVKQKSITQDSSIRDRDGTKLNNTPGRKRMFGLVENNYSKANRRSVWTISTEPCKQAHFATYPSKLVELCVKAGTSEKGCCPACGSQWKRVVEKQRVATRPGANTKIKVPNGWDTGKGAHGSFHREGRGKTEYRDIIEIGNRDPQRHVSQTISETWLPGCKCPVADPVPSIVFDPFSGAGTTALTAVRLGRRGIGTELNADYIRLTMERAPKFLAKKHKVKRTRKPCATMTLWPEVA